MILGLIAARAGSKGIPRKATKEMCGVPLIVHTIVHAIECGIFDRIVVSTDDAEIACLCPGNVDVFIRPDYLAQDDTSKWDVFRYIAGQIPCDILVDLDVGCPLRDPGDITSCVNKLKATEADVVVTAYPSERNPYFNMVHESGSIVCQSRGVITRRQDAPAVYSVSPSVFAIKQGALWKFDHWSRADTRILAIPRERAVDIDTMEDWRYVEYLIGLKCA